MIPVMRWLLPFFFSSISTCLSMCLRIDFRNINIVFNPLDFVLITLVLFSLIAMYKWLSFRKVKIPKFLFHIILTIIVGVIVRNVFIAVGVGAIASACMMMDASGPGGGEVIPHSENGKASSSGVGQVPNGTEAGAGPSNPGPREYNSPWESFPSVPSDLPALPAGSVPSVPSLPSFGNEEEVEQPAPPIPPQEPEEALPQQRNAPAVLELGHQLDRFVSSFNRIAIRSDYLIGLNEKLQIYGSTPERLNQIVEGIRVISALEGQERPTSGKKAGDALLAYMREWDQQQA